MRRREAMSERRVHGNDLKGAAWDAVRRVRRETIGDEGRSLSDDGIPEGLLPLLPYASLLGTGEEGAWQLFWDVMDPPARRDLLGRVTGIYAEINAYIDAAPDCLERDAMLDLRNMCEYCEDEL
jgi:hypothetical protein